MDGQKEAVRPRGTDSARVIKVIVTEALEGGGTESDPCRVQRRYWSLEGKLLATGDSGVNSCADPLSQHSTMLDGREQEQRKQVD